ncbi:MAG: GAF domain-containing protein [Chloroflexi bacterium]|nr:GAF domain-containing protein [Chloroflexota bacterium]
MSAAGTGTDEGEEMKTAGSRTILLPASVRLVIQHLFPFTLLLLTVSMQLATPIWAFGLLNRPFIGALLEPTMVVSAISSDVWPVKKIGINLPDRLIEVEGQPIAGFGELQTALERHPQSIRLKFENQELATREVTIAPIRFGAYDFISLFGVPWLVGLVFLGVGLWVYRARGESPEARAFLMFCAAISLTTTTFLDMNSTHHVAWLWAASIAIAGASVFHLALVFPTLTPPVRRWPIVRFLPWLPGVALIANSTLSLQNAADPWAYFAAWRSEYLFSGLGILIFLASLVYRMWLSDSPTVRQQSRIIVFGVTLAFGPVMFYLVPAALAIPIPFLPAIYFPFFVLFPLAVGYAILRYRLLDVDRALSRGVAYVLMTAIVVAGFLLLLNLLSLVIGQTLKADNPITISLLIFALAVGFNPLRDRALRVVDRVFYRERVDYRRELAAFSRELTQTLDLSKILRALRDRIDEALKPSSQSVFLLDEDSRTYLPHSVGGPPPQVTFHPDGDLARILRRSETPLYILGTAPGALGGDLRAIALLGALVFVPLKSEGRLSGWLALGLKRSEEPYSGDDLAFLEALADQSALAVENARLFNNLRRTLDQTMEMKNLMDNIFASIASGVITTDVRDQVTLFNRAAERILGIPAGAIVGQSYPVALAELGRRLQALIEQVKVEDRVEIGQEFTPEVPGRGPVNLRLSLSPLKDHAQATVGVAIVVDDLTEQRHLEDERRRIKATFERVVTPSVVEALLSDPANLQLGGRRQEITTLFADLRRFSTFSETLPPEVLIEVINQYLTLAGNAVLAENGTLDKYMGDAVMAIFNAPIPQSNHTLRAVRAALRMRDALEPHRNLLDNTYPLYFGIGITVGDAVVGNVGTPDLFNYTAIGDTVNLAKRLQENANPNQILLTAEAYSRVKDHVEAAALPPIQVKGRQAWEQIYEVKCLKTC